MIPIALLLLLCALILVFNHGAHKRRLDFSKATHTGWPLFLPGNGRKGGL